MKAKVPAHWTNTISAWVWVDGQEGSWKSTTKDGEWYVINTTYEKFNIIFVNGSNWNGDANQSENIEGITQNTCYQLTQEGGSKATYRVVDCGDDHAAVEDVEVSKPMPRKVIINQALYLIMPNGDVYDASGRMIRL